MAKRGRKRAAPKGKEEEGGSKAQAESSKPITKAKRPRRVEPKPKPETEYFEDRRNLEDLWQAAFPVGTEWDNMDKLRDINWKFSNLEDAFEEGGVLHGKKVYLFGSTEPQLLNVNGESKVTLIPVVVAVDMPFPPSDKIGIKSVQRVEEDIVPMKQMKMDWIPYVPLENRQGRIEGLKSQIFTLGCTQRRSTLKLLKTERVKQYDYCIPYFQPLEAQDDEEDTVVNILFPIEPPIVCDFDWELDELEDFCKDLIENETLPEDKKDEFKNYVKEQVRERKAAQRQAREARRKMIESMNPEVKAAFENMKLYKFYPVSTPDTPDINSCKVPFINRYYGKAHQVL
ncbi:Serine/Threonine-kinase [Rhynchospora pubera]|uniref:Serine/Threonine-kinase n=1 Tax=Rhynchospora pubera TaxID=906938 RepID=A0AAV8EM98_9POAL|nr:Serine/Threonine-kinase [Rhynchospora pubera]KAJ4786533.1 Serine/Threonine-kinase [Rhynchospora pubera]